FRGRRHHRARGIVDRRGRLALGPVDRAVGGGVAGGGARPFPEAHCRTSKTKTPPSGASFHGHSPNSARGHANRASVFHALPPGLRLSRSASAWIKSAVPKPSVNRS